jgi:hypothetical protein
MRQTGWRVPGIASFLAVCAVVGALAFVPSASGRSDFDCCTEVTWTLTFDPQTWKVSVTSQRPLGATLGVYYVCLQRVFVGASLGSNGLVSDVLTTPGPSPNQCGSQRTSFDLSFVIPESVRDRAAGKTQLYVQLEFYVTVSGTGGNATYPASRAKSVELPLRAVCCSDTALAAVFDPDDKTVDATFTIPGKKLCGEKLVFGRAPSSGVVTAALTGTWSNCAWTDVIWPASFGERLAATLDLDGDVYVQVQFRCTGGSPSDPKPPSEDCRGAGYGGIVLSTATKLRVRKTICCVAAGTSAIYDATVPKMWVKWTLPSKEVCAQYVLFGPLEGEVVGPVGRGDVGCDAGQTSATFARQFDPGVHAQVKFRCRAGSRTSGPSAQCAGGAYDDWLYGRAAPVCYVSAVTGRSEEQARKALRDGGCADTQVSVEKRCDKGPASLVLAQAVRDYRVELVVAKKCLGEQPAAPAKKEGAKPAPPAKKEGGGGAPAPAKRDARTFDGNYVGKLEWAFHQPKKPDVHGRTKIAFNVEGGAIAGAASLRGKVAAGGAAEATFAFKGYTCTIEKGAFARRDDAVSVRAPFTCRLGKLVTSITGTLIAKRR